jgi:hypothetical protein
VPSRMRRALVSFNNSRQYQSVGYQSSRTPPSPSMVLGQRAHRSFLMPLQGRSVPQKLFKAQVQALNGVEAVASLTSTPTPAIVKKWRLAVKIAYPRPCCAAQMTGAALPGQLVAAAASLSAAGVMP